MKYKQEQVANPGEFFVIDTLYGKKSVRVVKKKIKNKLPTDIPILCDRCRQSYADYLDPAYPSYTDFTLCKYCKKELDSITIGGN